MQQQSNSVQAQDSSSLQQQSTGPRKGDYLAQWEEQDELDQKIRQILESNILFYQRQISQLKAKHAAEIDAKNQVIQAKTAEVERLGLAVEDLNRQLATSKAKIKKAEEEFEEAKNTHKIQKEKTTEMLIKEKAELFQKYSQVQEENLVVLQFTEKIE